MKITIHRGANQIGGCITEFATKDAKIFIDLGSNLPGSDKTDYSADDVRRITADADAIFYSHYHDVLLELFPYIRIQECNMYQITTECLTKGSSN